MWCGLWHWSLAAPWAMCLKHLHSICKCIVIPGNSQKVTQYAHVSRSYDTLYRGKCLLTRSVTGLSLGRLCFTSCLIVKECQEVWACALSAASFCLPSRPSRRMRHNLQRPLRYVYKTCNQQSFQLQQAYTISIVQLGICITGITTHARTAVGNHRKYTDRKLLTFSTHTMRFL